MSIGIPIAGMVFLYPGLPGFLSFLFALLYDLARPGCRHQSGGRVISCRAESRAIIRTLPPADKSNFFLHHWLFRSAVLTRSSIENLASWAFETGGPAFLAESSCCSRCTGPQTRRSSDVKILASPRQPQRSSAGDSHRHPPCQSPTTAAAVLRRLHQCRLPACIDDPSTVASVAKGFLSFSLARQIGKP
ncbi:hypothetical protein BJ166DRAFT_234519 [Pestalotiopsis sp. NC0098]|nr:hypothetical protein BJ166DRAFT_234519 [Pestalotiopsis sp. NC0098]